MGANPTQNLFKEKIEKRRGIIKKGEGDLYHFMYAVL
jgi:hypothetical protein